MTELPRPLKIDRIGAAGLAFDIAARPEELEPTARRLLLPAVHALSGQYELRRLSGGTVQAEGVLQARVEQICVLTLEPFTADVTERFTVHFVPAEREEPEPEPDAIDQIPYEGVNIDLGEALIEQLALALDPYPRRPGAILPEWLTSSAN